MKKMAPSLQASLESLSFEENAPTLLEFDERIRRILIAKSGLYQITGTSRILNCVFIFAGAIKESFN